jgi:hypothetical protein
MGNDSECYGYKTLTPCWFLWLEGYGREIHLKGKGIQNKSWL